MNVSSLNDLRAMPWMKIIVKPKSYVDDLFETNPEKQDLKSRIEYLNIHVSNFSSLIDVTDKISEGTHVLIDDKDNFRKYLKTLQFRKEEEYFMSKEIRWHLAFTSYKKTKIYIFLENC